jgi:hypothetical protein
MEPITKGRIEIDSAMGPGQPKYFARVACGGFITSLLNQDTVEEAIEDGLDRLRIELTDHLKAKGVL